ncbi:MAG: EamA family transporter [Rhodobacteraceae bacterium]|nr:EamA family transporter [Paracoccaceae bacterium]
MSEGVFFAVLAAALLHATWNALIKTGGDRLGAILAMTLVQASLGLALTMFHPWPAAEVWPWLVASGALHAVYKLFLLNAYEHGDLSRVYPIARGTAPFLVLVVGGLFISDKLQTLEIAGVAVLITGILTMAHGVFRSGESRRLLPFALGSALATAGYSIVDGLGARVAGNATMFVGWLFMLDLLILFPTTLLIYRRLPLPRSRARWIPGAIAAAASYGAYWITVWAMTIAPIALVTALRETSILFAVLIGWLIFGERMNAGKAVAAALILTGVVLTRL